MLGKSDEEKTSSISGYRNAIVRVVNDQLSTSRYPLRVLSQQCICLISGVFRVYTLARGARLREALLRHSSYDWYDMSRGWLHMIYAIVHT